jgi:hypothetical protein
MLENVADGFLGFFMFFAHWLSIGNNQGEIRIVDIKQLESRTVLECVITFDWNERMNDLIDAGIPLRFRVESYSDRGDTTVSIRSLQCDISDYIYSFSDSLVVPPSASVFHSGEFNQVYRALREFQHVSRSFSQGAESFQIEAVLLPSSVSQLNRSIDMSDICGFRRFSARIVRKGRK